MLKPVDCRDGNIQKCRHPFHRPIMVKSELFELGCDLFYVVHSLIIGTGHSCVKKKVKLFYAYHYCIDIKQDRVVKNLNVREDAL